MKVVDALGQIYWYTSMCHLLKGLPPKFQILSWNIVAYKLQTSWNVIYIGWWKCIHMAWSYVLLKVIHLLQSNHWLIIKFILVVR
jgi:hypothetical protein